VGDAEQHYDVSVVLLKRDGEQDMHPAFDRQLAPGDTLAVLGAPECINHMVHDNR
jgi:K+/H+ antiporter YhaU regulatory subunit KhtT